jgi:hypothetical protein
MPIIRPPRHSLLAIAIGLTLASAPRAATAQDRCGAFNEYMTYNYGNTPTPLQWSYRLCNGEGGKDYELIFRYRNTAAHRIEFDYRIFVDPPVGDCETSPGAIDGDGEEEDVPGGSSVGGELSGNFTYLPKSQYKGRVYLCIKRMLYATLGQEGAIIIPNAYDRAAAQRKREDEQHQQQEQQEQARRLEQARHDSIQRVAEANRQAEARRAAQARTAAAGATTQSGVPMAPAVSTTQADASSAQAERQRQAKEEAERQERERQAREEAARQARENQRDQLRETGRGAASLVTELASTEVERGRLDGDVIFNAGVVWFDAQSNVSDAESAAGYALGGTMRRFINLHGSGTRLELGARGHFLAGSTSFMSTLSNALGGSDSTTTSADTSGITFNMAYVQPYAQLWFGPVGVGVKADWRTYQISSETSASKDAKYQGTTYVPMVTLGSMHEASGYYAVSFFGQPSTNAGQFWGGGIEVGMGMLQLQLDYLNRSVIDRKAPIHSDDQLLVTAGIRFP